MTDQTAPKEGYERSSQEPRRERFCAILRPGTIVLLIGVLALQALFIASYVGAFHSPTASRLKVTVVSHNNWQGYTANQLNAIDGQPVWAYASSSDEQATDYVLKGIRQGVYIVDPEGDTDILEVASAQGASNATALETVFQKVAQKNDRKLVVRDLQPPQSGDNRGLSSFYLVVGWMVGGYLMATMIGMEFMPRARNFRRVLWRLGWAVAYAVISGLVGAWVVDQWAGALTGHYWQLAGIGVLVSLAASLFTLGLEALVGVIGVGVAILLFVVAGNPSAGGAYSYELLPQPWRAIGPWLPNGAGVDAVRSVIHQQSYHLSEHLARLGWWITVGLLLLLVVSNNTYWGRSARQDDAEPERGRNVNLEGRHAFNDEDE